MALHEATFVQPGQTPIEGYDPEGLFDWVQHSTKLGISDRKMVHLAAKRFPWFGACVPDGKRSMVDALMAEEPTVTYTNPDTGEVFLGFRQYAYHIDSPIFAPRLRTFVTGQAAVFASGTFTYESPAALSGHEFTKEALKFGDDWLEQAVGLTPEQVLGPVGVISGFIKNISGLEITPGQPGVLYDGLSDETLHSSSLISENSPDTRVIYRTLYSPAE